MALINPMVQYKSVSWPGGAGNLRVKKERRWKGEKKMLEKNLCPCSYEEQSMNRFHKIYKACCRGQGLYHTHKRKNMLGEGKGFILVLKKKLKYHHSIFRVTNDTSVSWHVLMETFRKKSLFILDFLENSRMCVCVCVCVSVYVAARTIRNVFSQLRRYKFVFGVY